MERKMLLIITTHSDHFLSATELAIYLPTSYPYSPFSTRFPAPETSKPINHHVQIHPPLPPRPQHQQHATRARRRDRALRSALRDHLIQSVLRKSKGLLHSGRDMQQPARQMVGRARHRGDLSCVYLCWL